MKIEAKETNLNRGKFKQKQLSIKALMLFAWFSFAESTQIFDLGRHSKDKWFLKLLLFAKKCKTKEKEKIWFLIHFIYANELMRCLQVFS